MPTLPYTSEEFLQVLNSNANLHDEYVASGEIIQQSAETLQQTVSNLIATGSITPTVVNESGVAPTGTYATAVYYDLNFGVKVAYDRIGNIYLIMKGGTTGDYENLRFVAGEVPEGVTIETTVPASTSYVTMMPAKLQVGIIHGVTGLVNLTLTMNTAGNSSYDYIDVTIDITPADATETPDDSTGNPPYGGSN